MCTEFERVQRVVQDDVWAEEKDANGEPDESRMVKKFRRSAAGLEEQLPSDLRSPVVLRQTCDYLFNEVIGNAPSLSQIHHFVWDRTRAIRNDFSIQQLTKIDELRIAVECYERIARFHILSLHQLASPKRPYAKYDWSQEREQLDRTLLSLVQYYEDTRNRITFPNEAEFRAYCVIFQLRSPTPDLEDTVQTWPRNILRDNRVRKALDLYAAGCTVMGAEGPLNPKAAHLIARQDWQRFWALCASNEVSYLMGCVSEVYFNSIRRMVLNALLRTFRANSSRPTIDWTPDVLCELLALEDEDEVETYCKYFGFDFKTTETGQTYLELASSGRVLPQPNAEMPNQLKSSLVENKRLGRTLPSVINGMTVQQAQQAGLVIDEEHDEGMEDVDAEVENMERRAANDDEESLFIPEDKPDNTHPGYTNTPATTSEQQIKQSPFAWGQPSPINSSPSSNSTPTAQPITIDSKPKFDFLSGASKGVSSGTHSKPSFDFLNAANKPAEKSAAGSSTFNFLQAGTKTLDVATEKAPTPSFLGGATASPPAPAFNFTSGNTQKFTPAPSNGAEATPDQTPSADTVPAKASNETTSQHIGVFSKPVQEQTAGSSLFKFVAPSASNPSGDQGVSAPLSTATEQVNLANAPSAVAAAASTTASPDSPVNPFLQHPPRSPTQTSSETTPSFPSQQSKQAQPHFIAPSSDTPPSLPNKPPPSPSNLNTNLRRPSTSADTRPKKPSPLSNSFTATDESSAAAREPGAAARRSQSEKPSITVSPSTQQALLSNASQATARSPSEEGQLKKPVPFEKTRSERAGESFDATVTRIAKELVDDPVSGYLKQYVEYKASQIITSVQEQIAAENMKLRLKELRITTLFRKYFKRWTSFIWQRRLAKSGKDRRQRRRKRLEEGFDDGSSQAGESMRGSRAGSVLGGSIWKDHQDSVDAMFQRTMNSRALARSSTRDQQTRAGGKRPSSSRGDDGVGPRASTHKRLKSTSHVDDRGRVTKPTAMDSSVDDIFKRSSFLDFSVNGPSPPNKNTTRSNYFKLKAMGVHRAEELSGSRGTKRPRTESTQPAETSPPVLRHSTSTVPSLEHSETRSLMPPPSETASRAQKAKDEDDALFARLRAARESLTVGAVYMRSEVDRDEEQRRSLSASLSSNESPSMIKARADARFRASRAGSLGNGVPAYRLRESKFVPREQYGRAIERSMQMRESRSRETSQPATRPASRSDQKTSTQGFGLSVRSTEDDSGHSPSDYANGSPRPKSPMQYLPASERTLASFSHVKPPPAVFGFADRHADLPPPIPHFQPKTPHASADGGTQTKSDIYSESRLAPKSPFSIPNSFGNATAFDQQLANSAQQPGLGSQSLFDRQPPDSNPFRSFGDTSMPSFGGLPAQSGFAPRDHTVRADFIDQSLANSFGDHHEGHDESAQLSHETSTQHNSYVNSQAISLLSDDEDDTSHELHVKGLKNATGDEQLSDDIATDEERFQAHNAHFNSFAVLAGRGGPRESRVERRVGDDEMYDRDEFGQDHEQFDDSFESQEAFVNEAHMNYDDHYYGGQDEDGVNGDVEDGSELDGEGEEDDGFDSDEEEEDEEDEQEGQAPQPWRKVEYADSWRAKPTPNPALQGIGKTEDAPIELDSD